MIRFSKTGMALPLAVLVFLIVSIILASVAFVFENNLSQAHQQEENTKAYYLALAGLELGYTAMLKNTNNDPNAEPIYYFSIGFPLATTPPKVQEIDLDKGKVTIMASRKQMDGYD